MRYCEMATSWKPWKRAEINSKLELNWVVFWPELQHEIPSQPKSMEEVVISVTPLGVNWFEPNTGSRVSISHVCKRGKKWAQATFAPCHRCGKEENASSWPMLGRWFAEAERAAQFRCISLVPKLLTISEALSVPPFPLMSLLVCSRLRNRKTRCASWKYI